MSDKRQRARVQGSWAKPLHKPQQPTGMTTLQEFTYYNTCTAYSTYTVLV